MKRSFVGNKDENKIKDEDFYIAWKDKLEQINLKAELAFGEDKKGFDQLSKIVSEAIEAVENLAKKKRTTKKKYIIIIVAASIAVIAFTVSMPKLTTIMVNSIESQTSGIRNPDDDETDRLNALMSEIQADIAAGDYDSAELKLADLRWKYGSAQYHQADIDSWNAKRELLQKQIDSKRGEK